LSPFAHKKCTKVRCSSVYTPQARSPFWVLNQPLNKRMRVCYLDCHEAGLCCYLVIHTENLLHQLQVYASVHTVSQTDECEAEQWHRLKQNHVLKYDIEPTISNATNRTYVTTETSNVHEQQGRGTSTTSYCSDPLLWKLTVQNIMEPTMWRRHINMNWKTVERFHAREQVTIATLKRMVGKRVGSWPRSLHPTLHNRVLARIRWLAHESLVFYGQEIIMSLLCEKKIYCEYSLVTWTNHHALGQSVTFWTIDLFFGMNYFLAGRMEA
jgi:hypothetical protein